MPREEIRPLTGVRGVAALWVLFLHYSQELRALFPEVGAMAWLYGRGHLGVDVFFVLSGFIISYVYQAERFRLTGATYLKFLWYRFARIYPNHLATLLALVAMVGGAAAAGVTVTGDYPWGYVPVQLLMMHAWPWFEQGTWNYPAWSISAEWFAYAAIFPLAVVAARVGAVRRHGWLACYLALGVYVALWVADRLGAWERIAMVSLEFLGGSMLYHVFAAGGASARRASRLLPWLVAGILLLLFVVPPEEGTAPDRVARALIVLACPLVILGLTLEDNPVSRLLCRPVMTWLGLISYALYMVHAVVEKVLKVVLPTGGFADAGVLLRAVVAAAHVGLPILAAAALYRLVELPCRDVLRRVWQRLLGWVERTDAARRGRSAHDPGGGGDRADGGGRGRD